MSEGWEECPVLPVGWKRREVYRRSGATIGKSDTYYMSPAAERFRSKVELVKYFGESLDLTYFDFKRGIIMPPDSKMRRSVKRLSASPSDQDHSQEYSCPAPGKRPKMAPALALALAPSVPPTDNAATMDSLSAEPLDTLIVCCEGCQQWVPGVLFGPKKRRLRFYCAECRAKRRELGRKLNYYKRFGCGECTGCTAPGDCGSCRNCAARSSTSGKRWTCERRRCHKLEIKAETQDKKSLGEPKKKVRLHTHRSKKSTTRRTLPTVAAPDHRPRATGKLATKKIKSVHRIEKKALQKAKARRLEAVEREKSALKPTPPTNVTVADEPPAASEPTEASGSLVRVSRGRRSSRVCGACSACRRAADCGVCDFCQDKAKFGGANTLRQKCRWKQCLCFASKRLLPREEGGESAWADWKDTGYRASRRGRWKENAFVSRKVARIIQAARKRKMWHSTAHPPASAAAQAAARHATGKPQPAGEVESARTSTGSAVQPEDGGQNTAHSPVTDGSSLKVGRRSPEARSASENQGLNLKKFLSVMKPFLKRSRFSETHARPSVIRETSEWQQSGETRQSLDSTPGKPSGVSTPASRESPDPDPVRPPGATLLQEVRSSPTAAPHQPSAPVSRHREHKDRSNRKTSEEPGLNGTGSHSLSQRFKEEQTDPTSSDDHPVSTKRPTSRTHGSQPESRIVKRESAETNPEYGRSPPTPITQIFSLGSPYMMMSLEPLLRSFTHELMLLPLPASWVVCSSLGPDVQLIQLSRKSPVWDSVVQILPGFHYHVLVRGLPVPPAHRLYRSHPTRLASAADVLELIGDLETYRVCAGFPHLPLLLPSGRGLKIPVPPPVMAALLPHQRSSHCEVLVDKERCSRCAATV